MSEQLEPTVLLTDMNRYDKSAVLPGKFRAVHSCEQATTPVNRLYAITCVYKLYSTQAPDSLPFEIHGTLVSSKITIYILIYFKANRDETTNVDYGRAMADADALYRAGEKRWGTDESRQAACLKSTH